MSQATLQRILSEVEELSIEEKVTLIEALQSEPERTDEVARVDAFHQALLASGLVTELKRPDRSTPDRMPPLIHVSGGPLSETVIEDRR